MEDIRKEYVKALSMINKLARDKALLNLRIKEFEIQSRKDSDQINALTESGIRQQARIKELEEEIKQLKEKYESPEYGTVLQPFTAIGVISTKVR